MTFNVVDGAAAAAGAFFVLRALPLIKSVLGLGTLGNAGSGRADATEVYLKEIAANTRDMRDGVVRLSANFDTHDQTMREALQEMRNRVRGER